MSCFDLVYIVFIVSRMYIVLNGNVLIRTHGRDFTELVCMDIL
jgi:hypothetical protein